MELVAEKGSRQISYGDVATRASVSVGKLQHHFGSRDALIRKAFEHQLLHVTDRIHQLLEHPGTVTTRLRAAADEVSLRNSWNRATIWIDLLGRSVDSEEYRALRDRVNDSWRYVFKQLLAEGVAAGECELRCPIDEAVAQIVAMGDGLTVHTVSHGLDRVEEQAPIMRAMFARTVESVVDITL